MTDEELLQHFTRGNGEGMTELYLRLKAGLYSYIYNRVQRRDVAEDIMQDVWSKLILESERIAGLLEDSDLQFSLRPYLYRMAANRIVDYFRENGRLQELGEDESYLVSGYPDPNRSVAERDLIRCIERRMRPLRVRLHEAFWLTRDESMTYAEAATALGVARETVKDWVRQVLKAIRPCREEYENA